MLDPRISYDALLARDERFDGRLFVGVVTTGIYCRPVCPATTPKRDHCRFFPSAAAAHEAGFRPCLRCRPETAPDQGAWRGTSNTVSRALALISEGELDGDDASVEALAERLGIGARQLRRLFDKHLGATPIAVAQTRRVLFAKQLIHETSMPMADVALASGFGSVRRFNETFRALFDRPPSALRTRKTRDVPGTVSVRMRYRRPYDWPAVLAHLRARAIDGVERVDERRYARTIRRDGAVGTIEVTHAPASLSLEATVRFPCVRALPEIVARLRRQFDVGADVAGIGAHLARDPWLAPLVAERPGLRVPGGWDGFETAVRAILGQQVSVEHARRLGVALTRLCGARFEGADPALSVTFPTPSAVAAADLSGLPMPGARRRALGTLARAALRDEALFRARATVEETVAHLRELPGIGEWSAQYVALRAAREPDAFPASDAGLLRGAARGGERPTPAELLARAERWRPFRAYAAQHLWAVSEKRSGT